VGRLVAIRKEGSDDPAVILGRSPPAPARPTPGKTTSMSVTGRWKIIEAVPARKLLTEFDFQKPGKSHGIEEFTLRPEGDGTLVIWTIRGRTTFVTNVMMGGWFVDTDARIGKEFEAGLADLKNSAETP
jgi:hypothetical protein